MPSDLSEFFAQYALSNGNVENGKRLQLLALKDRLLYAWTKNGLRAVIGLKYSSTEGNTALRNCTFEFEVKFTLTKKPEGNIEWIELNRSGSCLAIRSDRRVYAVFLPRALWLLRSLNEVEKEYLCRCVSIDEGIGKKNKGLQCLRIRWHPGSTTDRHLVTLWSDDVIRIYHVGQTTDPTFQISLDISGDECVSGLKTRIMRSSLGESAVSFDFGAPVDLDGNSESALWPIFILCGNGDVYSVMNDIKQRTPFVPVGPLVISPATDNNYGTDACDIAFIHGKLPMLIIATSYGILYHALVIRDEKQGTRSDFVFELHVYESVELEFALSTLDLASTEVKEDNETSNIAIMKDSLISHRYYAYHRAGLHTVDLSWAHDLETEGQPILSDVASNVEYVLCTTPKRSADSSESCPIGLALVSSLSIESGMVVLLSDFSIYCLPANYDAISGLSLAEKADDLGSKRLPNRDYFIDTVKRILQKGATVPVLRARADKQLSEQEAAELMCRCLEVLRKEYVERLVNAREACEKHVSELTGIFAQQNHELMKVEQQIKSIRDQAQKSGRRREELAEKQRVLCERLERAAEAMTGGETGELSAQEENMFKELEDMKENLAETLDKVDQIKEKSSTLTVVGPKDRANVATPFRIHELSVKKRLEEQQYQIESLLRTVKSMQNSSSS